MNTVIYNNRQHVASTPASWYPSLFCKESGDQKILLGVND
jgi:hypothetical protein